MVLEVEDDNRSVEIASSSRKDSSAVALAAAINSHGRNGSQRGDCWG